MFLLAVSILPVRAQAQEQLRSAPVNPAFNKYFSGKSSATKSSGQSNPASGYIPAPFQVHFNGKDRAKSELKAACELPLQYDLREEGLVTPVKNQGSTGSCWTFATIGSIESRWLKLENQVYDLSEQNLGMCHDYEWGIDEGGNDQIAAAYLTRLDGPVDEADDPYQGLVQVNCVTGLTPVAYSPEVRWLPARRELLKEYLMKYGAISVSMYTGGSQMSSYYNPSDYTFYYTGDPGNVDHAVLVVGWDDQKVVTGGSASENSIGAWIVKNSWGSSWGENGYFYVSYNDHSFLNTAAIYPEKAETASIEQLIMHDRLGMVSAVGGNEPDMYGLMHIPFNSPAFITGIGTFIPSEAATTEVTVYGEFQGDTLLKQVLASGSFQTRFPGYYRFDLPLVTGSDIWVRVKYHTPNYNYPLPVEHEISGYAYPEIQPAGTFWYSEDGKDWKSTGSGEADFKFDLCIRAYVNSETSLVPWFTASRKTLCTGSSTLFTDCSSGSPESVEWNFGEGAVPATASGTGPHMVSYTTPGWKSITQTITSGTEIRTITREDYVEVVSALDIYTSCEEVELADGDSLIIEAFGAESYEWTPSATLSAATGQTVTAKPSGDIVYTVTGTMGTCTGSSNASITIVYPPENDDICDAVEIEPGFSGTFTNVYATVERGEPAPPEGECDKTMQWCVEGGLQNSVWFTFIAPESGRVSIITEGMDTQLALYEAESCDSVTIDHLVAAFDDYFGENKSYAAALDYVAVTAGNRYYVQCDGSAGGEEGEFLLYMTEFHVGIESKPVQAVEPTLNLYPNPSSGLFTVELLNAESKAYTISVSDLSGREIWSSGPLSGGNELHYTISGMPAVPGVYLLKVQTDRISMVKSLILKETGY